MRDFALHSGAVLIVAVIAGTALFGGREGWVSDSWGWAPAALGFAWSAACALVIGFLGLGSTRRALRCPPQQMVVHVMGGLILRGAVLVGTQLLVYVLCGPLWGSRTLLATTVFYLLVLAVEAYHLQRMLNRAHLSRTPLAAGSVSLVKEGEPGA